MGVFSTDCSKAAAIDDGKPSCRASCPYASPRNVKASMTDGIIIVGEGGCLVKSCGGLRLEFSSWRNRACKSSQMFSHKLEAVGSCSYYGICAFLIVFVGIGPAFGLQSEQEFRFEITLDPALPTQPPGRLLVVAVPGDSVQRIEPRRFVGEPGSGAVPTFGADAAELVPGGSVIVDVTSESHPLGSLTDLEAGKYWVQAVLITNTELRSTDAPGNIYSEPALVSIDPLERASVHLTLNHRIPSEELPVEGGYLRFIKIRSELLSRFHGRPIYLRAGVILPLGYDRQPGRRYPLRVRIGGFGERYTAVQGMMRPGSSFRAAWLEPSSPRMILLHLDGAGPYGDPYQVNSANNGPYGDAVTEELIPYVERVFRGIGRSSARVLDGSSTGGWVSLALQIFYPDTFNGAWASCPDSVDFRAFQLLDIYHDDNSYLDEERRERPSARSPDGAVRFTMRQELQMENVLGSEGSWTTSGRQWGAWNASYGPRGADGGPIPLWDPKTGRIDRSVTGHWEQYDLRLTLERKWDELAPKLLGKLNIWVGDNDDYYLDHAVRRLEIFLKQKPSIGSRIVYGPGRGHCWTGISDVSMMQEMNRQMLGR